MVISKRNRREFKTPRSVHSDRIVEIVEEMGGKEAYEQIKRDVYRGKMEFLLEKNSRRRSKRG